MSTTAGREALRAASDFLRGIPGSESRLADAQQILAEILKNPLERTRSPRKGGAATMKTTAADGRQIRFEEAGQ